MRTQKRRRAEEQERYEIERSPLSQRPTQKNLAELVGMKKSHLKALIAHKDQYIIRREDRSGKKLRHLAYPVGKLRTVHERLKIYLNRVRKPDYLLSPRAKRSQRDNALKHLGRRQFLAFDIKQFYPSTTADHVFRWARHELNMPADTAGLLTEIATVDGSVSFGSPLTPVLCTLIHRRMFDRIASECRKRGLTMSLWVDDIVISGLFVPGALLSEIRSIVSSNGLKTHKIKYRTGNRNVLITGIAVSTARIDAPLSLHKKIQSGYRSLRDGVADAQSTTDQLLSDLGQYRFIVGRGTAAGQRAAHKMEALRRNRQNLLRRSRPAALVHNAVSEQPVPW